MKLIKTTTTGIAFGFIASVLAITGFFNVQTANAQNFSSTFLDQITISIDSRKVASQPQIMAPYKTMDVFISEEKTADFEFTSVGGHWTEVTPSGTNIEALVRFKIDQKWTEWIELDEEDDFEEPGTKLALASTDGATGMQYKFLLYGDGESTPKVRDPEWTFIKAGKSISTEAPPSPKYSSSATVGTTKALAFTASSTNIGVISRISWGADEKFRYLEFNETFDDVADLGEDYYDDFKDELEYSTVVTHDQDGEEYKWPLQYPNKVQKFIIHHTATTNNLSNPTQAIRDIYYYHSVVRGWGDIGYNYLLDQQGNIYEGRYGGEGVVGGHAAGANNGSIGIAVLGNYEHDEVPQAVVTSLGNLISKKSKIHGIDPSDYSYFRGEFLPNVIGHKDVAATSCPGGHLYEILPVFRTFTPKVIIEKPKFVKEFDYQDRSDVSFVEIAANQSKEITIKFENIGTKDWNNETFIVVNENPDFIGTISFPTAKSYVLAPMQESLVKPGEIATFNFTIQASNVGKIMNMDIAPVVDGVKKIDDYKKLPVSVQQNSFRYEFVSADVPSEKMDAGQHFTMNVKLKNTGNTAWSKEGNNVVKLGTDHIRDRLSAFKSPGSTRLGYLQETTVQPGEIGTFTMNLVAPQEAGFYKEYYTPVVEGVTWMPDTGMYFSTTVFAGSHAAEVMEKTPLNTWERGKEYVVWVKMRNVGESTWTNQNFKPVLLTEDDLETRDAKLVENEVKPGGVGTLSFIAKVAPDEKIETKALLMRPQVEGAYINKHPIYFFYNVRENSNANYVVGDSPTVKVPITPPDFVAPSTEIKSGTINKSDIRIKLSFDGEPEITSLGSFDIYSGSKFLAAVGNGGIASVKYQNKNYVVSANNKTYTKSEEIRFIPKNNNILEIKNFDHPPAWNPNLNDNQYRGIIEFRIVDGKKTTINELPLEDYLKGLGEVSNSAESEKIKTIMVAARTYAKYYIDIDQKFPGKPYHLDDDPNVSQKYLGYGLEKRSPNVVTAVEETEGQFVTYQGEIVKTPYFNQSDGSFTKDVLDVWDWEAEYLEAVSDSFCVGDVFLGHGVGLSGCGASGMVSKGYNYVQILKYYYTGVEVTDMY